jgi:hypothetical protein
VRLGPTASVAKRAVAAAVATLMATAGLVAGTATAAHALVPNQPIVGMAATPDGRGYWMVAADGGIFTFGDAGFYGSAGALPLNKPVVGMAATPDGRGYWLVASDGGIFTYGDAGFYGSAGALPLNKPVVGMAVTPDGHGYWLVASDGGTFTYGDAGFYGSAGALPLNKPVVDMAATPDGRGYWLVASDGGIFTYGDAGFYGSAGALPLNRPVVGMARTASGHGYWLVASDGGIFTYGDAAFLGSAGALPLDRPVVGTAMTPNGIGYWLVASDGGLFTYGDAPYLGSVPGITPCDLGPFGYTGNLAGPKVGVVGDSVLGVSVCYLAPDLAPAYAYRIDTASAARMAAQLPTIDAFNASPGGPPADWVIELGTNDAGVPQNTNWQTDFNNQFAAVQSASCIIFITLSPHLAANGPVGPDINAAIAATAASHASVHVLDWGNIEYTNPGWVSPYDGIHPTPAGAQVLSSLVRQSLDSDCPP